MRLHATQVDLERTLFRFLTKSARKGELADREAARSRLPQDIEWNLDEIAAGMQRRIAAQYPDAPDLRGLLGDTAPSDLAAIQEYEWVLVGVYVFGLPPTKTRSGTAESAAHRSLKEWAAANGALLGAPADAVAVTERWFASGDESDAAFIGDKEALIVEVRPGEAEPHEVQQAMFKLVAMRSVMLAEGSSDSVGVTLVVERPLGEALTELAGRLGVTVFVK